MTLDELQGRLTCTVPEAGLLLGIGRDASYAAAERGEIPTLRLGRRLVVPVPRLLELVGVPSPMTTTKNSDGPDATSEPIATAEPEKGALTNGDTPHLRSA